MSQASHGALGLRRLPSALMFAGRPDRLRSTQHGCGSSATLSAWPRRRPQGCSRVPSLDFRVLGGRVCLLGVAVFLCVS